MLSCRLTYNCTKGGSLEITCTFPKSNRVVKYWLPASSVVYRTLRFLHIVFSNQMKLLENIKKEFRLTRILLGQIFDQVNKDLPTNR